MAALRLGEDWQAAYGYAPVLLETYVERDRFGGTCYRAANWVHVGTTCGRGRQDRDHSKTLPVKDIYLYPLRDDFRTVLCQEPEGVVCVPRASMQVHTSPGDWADEEFGNAALGDQRLRKRLLTVARDFFNRPQANIPQACGTRAKTKAAYRFFIHEDVTMNKVLAPHINATIQRLNQEDVVLAVQDTTSLNYSTHPATERLGPIGSSADGAMGLLVHDTVAFNAAGTPLGLLDVQMWARDPAEFGKSEQRHESKDNPWPVFRNCACRAAPANRLAWHSWQCVSLP